MLPWVVRSSAPTRTRAGARPRAHREDPCPPHAPTGAWWSRPACDARGAHGDFRHGVFAHPGAPVVVRVVWGPVDGHVVPGTLAGPSPVCRENARVPRGGDGAVECGPVLALPSPAVLRWTGCSGTGRPRATPVGAGQPEQRHLGVPDDVVEPTVGRHIETRERLTGAKPQP